MITNDNVKLTPGDAFDVYVEEYPNTIVKEIELELDSNIYVYKVEGYDNEKEYKVYVDAVGGEITQIKEKFFQGKHKEITKESANKIQAVVDKALEDAGQNSELHEWSLEIKDRELVLALEIRLEDGTEIKYKYDLDTSTLLKKK